jgi:protein-S-isoprenylcysteine O-methyltransferase Ste14
MKIENVKGKMTGHWHGLRWTLPLYAALAAVALLGVIALQGSNSLAVAAPEFGEIRQLGSWSPPRLVAGGVGITLVAGGISILVLSWVGERRRSRTGLR